MLWQNKGTNPQNRNGDGGKDSGEEDGNAGGDGYANGKGVGDGYDVGEDNCEGDGGDVEDDVKDDGDVYVEDIWYIDRDVEDGIKYDGDVDDKCWQLSRLYNGRCQKLGQGSVLATPPISRWLLFLDNIWRKKLLARTNFIALFGHS